MISFPLYVCRSNLHYYSTATWFFTFPAFDVQQNSKGKRSRPLSRCVSLAHLLTPLRNKSVETSVWFLEKQNKAGAFTFHLWTAYLTDLVVQLGCRRCSQRGWMSCSGSAQLSICACTQEPVRVYDCEVVLVCVAHSRENAPRQEWISTEMYMRFKFRFLFSLLPHLHLHSVLCFIGALVRQIFISISLTAPHGWVKSSPLWDQ